MTPLLTQIVNIISRESRRFARKLAASVVDRPTSLQQEGQQTSLQQEGQQISLQPGIQQTNLQQENLVILPTTILIPL